ncbi:MAG: hypothetical protein CMM50_15010 [Rhodospirillaceae bacterium]|nr:hypothetical protein [Rhodospirillaceae bacterium]
MIDDTELAVRPPRWRRYGVRLIGVVLFAAVLASVDLRQVWDSISRISLDALVEALGLLVLLLLLKCGRWFLLLTWSGIPQSVAESVDVYADSIFWGMITPGRLGELKRTLYLKRRHTIPLVRGSALWLVDQGFDILALIAILVAASLAQPEVLGRALPVEAAWGAAAVLAASLVLRNGFLRLLRLSTSHTGRFRYLVDEATRDLLNIGHGRFLILFAMSSGAMLAYVGMVIALSADLPIALSIAQQMTAVPLVMASALLPISYFNFGSRELVLTGVFALYGHGFADAISYSFVFVLCYLLVIPVSVLLSRLGRFLG